MRATVVFAAVLFSACGTPPPACHDIDQGATFCVPDSGTAAAGMPLTLQIVNGCLGGCGKSTLVCSATRDGGVISLAITGQVCEPPLGVACTLDCAIVPMDCEVPALEAGDYEVTSPDQTSRALHVSADAGSTACKASLF